MNQRRMTRVSVYIGVILFCFVFIGCQGIYKALGVPADKAAELGALDQEKTLAAVEAGRDIFWQTVSALVAGVGAVTTTVLGKWLSTERKITTAVIKGVEKAKEDNVKVSINTIATNLGIEANLSKRVAKLT